MFAYKLLTWDEEIRGGRDAGRAEKYIQDDMEVYFVNCATGGHNKSRNETRVSLVPVCVKFNEDLAGSFKSYIIEGENKEIATKTKCSIGRVYTM